MNTRCEKVAPSEENVPKFRGSFESDVNPRSLAGFLPKWTSFFLQDLGAWPPSSLKEVTLTMPAHVSEKSSGKYVGEHRV